MSVTYHLFLDQFGEAEWLTAEELVQYQAPRLARIVRHAAGTTSFYGEGLDGVVGGNGEIDWAAWAQVPVLTRQELGLRGHEIFSAEVPADHGEVTYVLAEGGADAPAVAWTEYKQVAEECLRIRLFAWHDINPGRRLARIDSEPVETEMADYWGKGFEALVIPGRLTRLEATRPAEALLQGLAGAEVLEAAPDALERLADAARRAGKPLRLGAVVSNGPPMPDTLPRKIRRNFGVEPIAAYRVPETGILAIQCPAVPGRMHLMADNALVEILGEDERPVPPGVAGRVVATPFFNYATPLIRYETGDWAVPAAPCSCGRSLPALARLTRPARYFSASVAEATV